jgi:hypothetical protein
MTDWLGMAAAPREPPPDLKQRVLARALAPRREPAWRLAAAAGLVLVMAGGAWAAVTMHRLAVERGRLAARVSALEDTLSLIRRPGTRVVQIPVATNGRVGSVTIFVDSATHRWLVTCHGLSPNLPGQAYQLWFITEQGMKSAAVMPMEAPRPMVLALEMPAGGARVMGAAMSIEPMPGSPEPKGPILFHVNL